MSAPATFVDARTVDLNDHAKIDGTARISDQGPEHQFSPEGISVTDATSSTIDQDDAPLAPLGWRVESAEQAEFALTLLLGYDGEVARREAALAAHAKQAKRAHEFFEPLLEVYYDANPPKKGKTLHLANGDLQKVSRAPKLVVVDEEALLTWAREHLADAIESDFVETVKKSVVNKHFEDAGEVPMGCGVTEEREQFYVKAPRAPKGGR